MNESPNSMTLLICPREKLLMLSRPGQSAEELLELADNVVVGKVCLAIDNVGSS